MRFSSLGDVLLCAPAIRALRARFPESAIDFLVATEFHDAATLIPGIEKVITFDRKDGWRGLLRLRRLLSRRYDIIVDLQNSLRSAFVRTFCFPLMWQKASRYRFRRWLLIRFKKNMYGEPKPVPLRYIAAMESSGCADDGQGLLLRPEVVQASSRRIALLCPGAKHFTKRWPEEHWVTLAALLRDRGFAVKACGSSMDAETCARIAPDDSVHIDMPMREVADLMQNSSVVVCHDSGLMHLATGVGVPVAAIFGPTVEEFGFFPFRAKSVVVQQDLGCRPCSAFGGKHCPLGHHDCMKRTTPDSVLDAVMQLISDRNTNG